MFPSVQTRSAQRLSCPHDNACFTEQQAARLCVHCHEPFLPRACQIVRCSICGTQTEGGGPPCLCTNARMLAAGYRCPSCLHEGGDEMLDAPPACPYCFTPLEDSETALPKPRLQRVTPPPIVFASRAIAPPETPTPKPVFASEILPLPETPASDRVSTPEILPPLAPVFAPAAIAPLVAPAPVAASTALMPLKTPAAEPVSATAIAAPPETPKPQPVSAPEILPRLETPTPHPAPTPEAKHRVKRFIPAAALFLCAAVAVAAACEYVPRLIEDAFRSVRSPAPKPEPEQIVPTSAQNQLPAQKPHPGQPAQPAPAPQGGEVPDGEPSPTAQTQPAGPASPANAPAQSPQAGDSPSVAPVRPPSPVASQPNQPPEPVNSAVVEKPPVIVAFTTSAQSIERGGSATLHWEVSGNEPTVTLSPGIGAVPPTGSWNVKPETTQQFTLTATNSIQSAPQSKSVMISVVPAQTPRIASFTADASQVRLGQTVTFRWTVTGASQVRIDPGVGPVSASGTAVFRPVSDTSYTLSASGPGGTSKATVAISVLGVPPAPSPYPGYPLPQGPAAPGATAYSRFQKDPAALRLLALAQAAMGGKRNLEGVHDWQQTGRVTWDLNGGTTFDTITFVAPSSIRVESQGGNTTVDFSNGETGWTWSSTRPARSNLPASTATGMPFRSLPELLLSDDDPQRSLTLAGPNTLVIVDGHNDRVSLRIDPATHLPQSIAWINVDGSELQENYSNWRQAAGVMWWFHATLMRNHQEFLRADVTGVRVNQGWSAPRIASAAP